ncbi:UNVERIFIED_CONTAM: hypothetical protein FKN15_036962 [Acipenser sinensis]
MFSEEELRVLTAEVTQHEIELFGKASANISYATKEAIWSSIVENVNAVSVTMRTVNQLTLLPAAATSFTFRVNTFLQRSLAFFQNDRLPDPGN